MNFQAPDFIVPVIFISGPSGVGKSTLLKQAIKSKWPDGLEVKVPKKFTTRSLRVGERKFELEKLSPEQFRDRKSEFLVHYQDYDKQYGLEAEIFERPEINKIYIQTMPTSMALVAKNKLSAPWKVFICRLEQDPQVILKRLIARGDKITLRQMVNRAKGANTPISKADFVIKTNREPDKLVEELKSNIANFL